MFFKNLLETRLLEFQNFSLTVADMLGVFVVYFMAWGALRFLSRALDRFKGDSWDKGRRHSVHLLAQYVVWLLAGTAMLEMLGVHVTVLVAGSAALLVGLGLGVQQIFRDIVSGIFLLFEGTIEVGDVLEVNKTVGKVEEIKLRTTRLSTRDGQTMIVPNYMFITENVINWSYGSEQPVRFQVVMCVEGDSDEMTVWEIMHAAACEHPDVLTSDAGRKPSVKLTEFGQRGLIFELNFWTLRKFEATTVASDLRVEILKKLREAGVRLAFTDD